jgi:hypothetical protein
VDVAGAETWTEHAVDVMPLPHEQDVTGLPPLQVTPSATMVPTLTGEASVFGDWPMVQLLGAEFTAADATWTVVLADGADPPKLEAVTEYEVVVDGADMLTEHKVDEMPPLQEHEVTGLPLLQTAFRVTVVPGITAAAAVFGDCEMLQLLGAVTTLLLPM